MSFTPTDAPEDESSGVFASADSEPAETPSAATFLLPSPEDVARDNARGGRWAMNEFYDGCVLLGADDKPVMRNDGSRVGFFFRDAQRLADELAAGSEPGALSSGNDADDRAATWRAQRHALATLDSGFNKDWDPQRPKSTLADMTKWTRLLAYYYVQSTEPEEAVRHAIADIFGKPLNGPRMSLWVPGKYNVETVEAVAGGLLRQVLGPEAEEINTVGLFSAPYASFTADAAQSLPLNGSDFGGNVLNVAQRSQTSRRRTPKLDSEMFMSPEQSAVPLSIPATDKAVLLYDSDGKPVMSVDSKGDPVQVLAPEGLNFSIFIEAGEQDKKEGDRAILQRLINFVHGGPWDLQRPVSEMRFGVPSKHKFVDDFVNVATVAIGVYAAAAGWSLDGILTWMNGFAWAFSDFGNVQFDSKYESLPERNVLNTTLGYNLQKNGKVPTSVY